MIVDIREVKGGLTIDFRVQPRSSKNLIQISEEGKIRLRLKSPPVDGKANEECIKFFSKIFDVSKKDITIIKGLKSKEKSIKIINLSPKEALDLMGKFVQLKA